MSSDSAPASARSSPSVATRLWLAFICSWRVVLDPRFGAAVARLARGGDVAPAPALAPAPPSEVPAAPPAPPVATVDRALQLLALLQAEGRLVDFLEQDVAGFSDADVGAAARVVHDGCRKALRAHATLSPVLGDDEGARVTVAAGFSPGEIKLTGRVQGAAPFSGVLRHRGWRATAFTLPTVVRDHDASVLAPAEVEL